MRLLWGAVRAEARLLWCNVLQIAGDLSLQKFRAVDAVDGEKPEAVIQRTDNGGI